MSFPPLRSSHATAERVSVWKKEKEKYSLALNDLTTGDKAGLVTLACE